MNSQVSQYQDSGVSPSITGADLHDRRRLLLSIVADFKPSKSLLQSILPIVPIPIPVPPVGPVFDGLHYEPLNSELLLPEGFGSRCLVEPCDYEKASSVMYGDMQEVYGPGSVSKAIEWTRSLKSASAARSVSSAPSDSAISSTWLSDLRQVDAAQLTTAFEELIVAVDQQLLTEQEAIYVAMAILGIPCPDVSERDTMRSLVNAIVSYLEATPKQGRPKVA